MMATKYRVWTNEFQEMYQWETIKSEFTMRDFEDNDFVWLLYTGLIDKKGKEIYNGDIIKRYKDSIILGKKTKIEFYQKIIYSEKYAQYLLEDNNGSQEHATWATAGEVIGNIYEHKHLLDKIT